MKTYFLFIAVFMLTSCVATKRNLSPEAKEFEHVLGRKKAKELTHLVSDFENLLVKTYNTSNSEDALKVYINEIYKSGDYSLIHSDISKLVSKELRDEIWLKPDSCYINGRFIICNYSYNNTTFKRKNIVTDKAKYSEFLSPSRNIIFNKKGLYFKGLKSIAKKDKIVANYIANLEISGAISPSVLVGLLVNKKVDFSNYFIKRIIYIDIYLQNSQIVI